ncbi:MAG: DNA internalization-related competence protein ComEC/Rec2 [Deltaproteobacteria bacterium]
MTPTSSPRGRGRPLVLAATAYALGALVDGHKLVDNLIATALFVALTLALAHYRRVLAVAFVPLAFFFAGIVTGQLRLPPQESLSTVVGPEHTAPVLLEGLVREAPQLRPDRVQMNVDLVGTATAIGVPLVPVEGRLGVSIDGADAACGAPGDRIRVFAKVAPVRANDFPGGVPRRALAARRGITAYANAKAPSHCLVLAPAERGGLVTTMERLRAALHDAVGRALPAESAAVVRAFATGDTSGIPPDTNDAFVRSGLSHLLAVSGLNLAIVSGLFVIGVAWILRRVRRVALGWGVKPTSALIAIPFVVLYTLLVGASPSAVRAGAMVLALLSARLVGRVAEAWSMLAFALIVMVAWDPTTLGDVSFQLSFAAVVALLRIYPALRDVTRLSAWPRGTRATGEVFLASLAATIGTAPLVARHFNRLSLAGLVANVPAAPLSSLVLVPLSLLGGLLGCVNDALAAPVLAVAGWAAEVLVWLATWSASWPLSSVVLPTPTIPEAILFYGAVIGFTNRPFARRWIAVGSLCLAMMVASIGSTYVARWTSDDVTLTFLPVGHGDAVWVELPGGATMLVDTGPPGWGRDAAERVVVPFLLNRRQRRADVVVISHADADHAGSLPTVMERLDVGEVWINGDARQPIAGLEGAKTRRVAAGDTFTFGEAQVRVLAPDDPTTYASENDASIVLEIALGERRVLLTGDIEADAEARLLEGRDVRADVVKAPHHGSRTSSTEPFVAAVGAEHVVFTVGHRDRFGHPHAEVVERWQEAGARVWRTDRDGAVTVVVGEEGVRVRGFLAPER